LLATLCSWQAPAASGNRHGDAIAPQTRAAASFRSRFQKFGGGAGQAPLARDLGKATQHELPQAVAVFEVADDRLGRVLAQSATGCNDDGRSCFRLPPV